MRGEQGRGGAYIQTEREAEADAAASGSRRPGAGGITRESGAGISGGKTQSGASLAAAPVREREEEGEEEGRGEGEAARGAQLRQEGPADGTRQWLPRTHL